MSDEYTKIKRSSTRRRNFMAKALYEDGDSKAYDPRKEDYKRRRINVKDIYYEFEDED